MKARPLMMTAAALFLGATLLQALPMRSQSPASRLVRLAELDINPASLDAYKAALKEEIETSIRVEPGVLTLYEVSVKDRPNQVRLFEIYASPAAYQAHLRSDHFKRYKQVTASMVRSLRLIETEPLMLGAK